MSLLQDALTLAAITASLLVLPGAWLAFAPRLRETDFGERFALAIALSPLVVVVEFYGLRLAGMSFDGCASVIPWLNVAAAVAVLVRLRVPTAAQVGGTVLTLAVLAVPVRVLSWRYFEHDPSQVFTAHTLIHTDIIYMLAGGRLVPEEAELAGVSIGYHWLGHVQPALLAARLDTAPPWIYLYMNHVWLAAVVILCVKGARHLGARTGAAVTAVLLVVLGVNAAGYAAAELLPDAMVERLKLDGLGWTFTPWLWKFQMFNQVTVGLAMFAAVAHLSLRGFWTDLDRGHIAVAAVALTALGLVYPVMFPIGGAVAGLAWLFALIRDAREGAGAGARRYIGAAVVLAAVAAVVVANLELITAERSGDVVRFFERRGMAKKAYDLAWVFLPFVIVLGVLRARREGRPGLGARYCILASLASIAAYLFLGVGALMAENKFIFTAAVTLGPPAALALQRAFDRLGGKAAWIVVAITAAVLPLPLVHKCESMRDAYAPPHGVDSSSFEMTFAAGEPIAGAAAAIIERTPEDTVLVSWDAAAHLPSFVRRSAYAPTRPSDVIRGVGLPGGLLLVAVRGHSPDFVEGRLADVRAVFKRRGAARAAALAAIDEEMDRPVAFVLFLPRDAALLTWLEGRADGKTIYRDEAAAVWLIE